MAGRQADRKAMPEPTDAKMIRYFTERKIKVVANCSLAKYCTFRTGGNAEILALPQSESQTMEIISYALQEGIAFLFLGGGSNVLISDDGLPGIVIKLNYPKELNIIKKTQNTLEAKAPANMKSAVFARKVCEMGYPGAEFLTTIPGELGGALVQNAGCYGSEMVQIVKGASVGFAGNGLSREISTPDLKLAYRSSIFKEQPDLVIHSVCFNFERPAQNGGSVQAEIDEKVRRFRENRLATQPRNRKTAGSVFKNPPDGPPAWDYLAQCGLRGYAVGGARFSDKHANFIENYDRATSSDIRRLMTLAQERVYEKFGVRLVPEIRLLGAF